MRVVGLDVCKSSVVCCVLESKPSEPRQFYYDFEFPKLEANASGIKALLALKPDIAVMEPTGVNYSKLWGTHLARQGIPVYLVGHTQLRSYRANHLRLPDKDDPADALALACYYFDYCDDNRRFVQIRTEAIVQIREKVLRLAHLNRVQSPIINRIRQDLAWQFPEVASLQLDSPVWQWLAGLKDSKRYDVMLDKSIGLGLTDTVRLHAKRLVDIRAEELAIEDKLTLLMGDSAFSKYREVFAKFGFGDRVQAMLLSQMYPIENYLGEDGKPIVIVRKGRNSGKRTKRYLSLRRFMKALGVAPTEESSGDKKSQAIVGGSDLCRKSLWQWVFTRIEVRRCRPKNEIGKALGDEIDLLKASGKPIRLIRIAIAAKAVRILFKELTKD